MHWQLDWSDYQKQIDGAVKAAHSMAQAVLPSMLSRSEGSIIHLASNLVARPTVPYHDYTTAKAALIGFSRNLAMELGPFGVRVNAICPGAVEGSRMDRVLAIEAEASGKTPQQVRAQYTGGVSLRSFVSGDDIADTVLFLASPAAVKITGQAMTIDGHTESMV